MGVEIWLRVSAHSRSHVRPIILWIRIRAQMSWVLDAAFWNNVETQPFQGQTSIQAMPGPRDVYKLK